MKLLHTLSLKCSMAARGRIVAVVKRSSCNDESKNMDWLKQQHEQATRCSCCDKAAQIIGDGLLLTCDYCHKPICNSHAAQNDEQAVVCRGCRPKGEVPGWTHEERMLYGGDDED
jgi:hypothetical protein